MTPDQVSDLARQFLSGQCSADALVKRILESNGDQPAPQSATVDVDRAARCGFPEVIFGEGKTPQIIASIARQLLARKQRVLATRIDQAKGAALLQEMPQASYNPVARTLRIDPAEMQSTDAPAGRVAVITAGTSDLPVAEEACETLRWMGVETLLVQDVGVAGPHRLPARIAEFADVDAILVVAGMEGALPSVVGGYVACPVFAVPTSVGYGANFGGVSALLSMLNSCAANVAVVNIDAGFKGGYLAGLVASRAKIRPANHANERE